MIFEKNKKIKNGNVKTLSKSKAEKLWVTKISLLAFFVSLFLTLFSQTILNSVHLIVSIFVLVLFVALNVVSDMIGLAITSCQIETIEREVQDNFVKEKCLRLVRNSDKVSSILCDVVGDISGILCGVSGSLIALAIVHLLQTNSLLAIVGALVSAVVAGVTVLFKAISKNFAVKNAKRIVQKIAKILCVFSARKK